MTNRKEYFKEYHQKHRKRRSEYNKSYYQKHKKEQKKNRKKYYEEHKEDRRKRDIFKEYNLLYEDWLKLWEEQDGKCAICEKSFIKISDAYIDHCHTTSKIRGLLCNKCNSALGFLGDDPNLTARATKYLIR